MKPTLQHLLVATAILLVVLAGLSCSRGEHSTFYRCHSGEVYIVSSPAHVWNGLRPGPTLQFPIPSGESPESWTPSKEQIIQALAKDGTYTDEEVQKVVAGCITVKEYEANRKAEEK